MSESLKPLKWYKELAEAKGRREAGCFLVEGERAIRQIAGANPAAIIELLTAGETPPGFSGYPVRALAESQLRSISNVKTPPGLMAVIRTPPDSYTAALPDNPGHRVLLLEGIQDPGNAGTLIRTAAAFDYSGVILTETGADPFSPRCVQAAAGSVLSLWLRRTDEYLALAQTLRRDGYAMVAATLDGDGDVAALRQEKLVLALGNEAAGISRGLLQMADYRFRLPVARAKAESLNVAVCGGICLYLSTH